MKKIIRDNQSVEVEDNYELQENEAWDTTQSTPNNEPPQPPTPPANQPDPSVLSAYQAQLLDQARENARLQRELAESRNKKQPEQITPEKEKEFFDRPHSTVVDIVRQELQQQTAPLNQYVAQMQRQQAYDNLKTQMRNNPAQFQYLTQVEGLLDQIMQTAQVVDANTIIAAYNTAVGYFVSNGGVLQTPQQQQNNQPAQPTNRNVPIPPHAKPAAPPPPNNKSGGKQIRQLNENEKKIARFNNMTDEEYLVWTEEIKPSEVAYVKDEDIKARVGGSR